MNPSDSQNNEADDPLSIGASHEGRLVALIETCMAAGHHTLTYFCREDVNVEAKSDDSPVTIADREAEELARQLLHDQFVNDTIQGEEFSEQSGDSAYRWIIDPIDGTKSFVCGVPLYSSLLALEKDGEPIAGAIYLPATGEMVFAANGFGCWYRRSDHKPWGKANVSDKNEIKQAVFVTSQTDLFRQAGAGKALQELEDSCWVSRSWGDGYGYLMVATGRADIMVDAICNAWDVAAMIPILREAGGSFTDWDGKTTPRGGNGIGTNGKLHEAVLSILR